MRTGDYRVIYEIHEVRLLVLILRLAHHCETYECGFRSQLRWAHIHRDLFGSAYPVLQVGPYGGFWRQADPDIDAHPYPRPLLENR